MTLEELIKYSADRGLVITDVMQKQLIKYAELLASWNKNMNLTSITDLPEVIEKHFLDCILPLLVTKINGSVVDVGSGAGFPGIVFAIVRPDLQLTLVEPTGKRCQFLNAVKAELSLGNVVVVNERAEDFAKKSREIFDVATARAVAALPVLSELCVPLIKKNGYFVPLKGSLAEQECKDSAHALATLGCAEPELIHCSLPSAGERAIVVIKKQKETPAKYPRQFGQIKKKPL